MTINAGSLDRTIVIERATTAAGEFNEPVQTWAPLATVDANKRDVSDRERLMAAEVTAELSTRFTIRWSPTVADVNPKDRIVYDGRVYSIEAVREIGRREGLEISASAGAD